MRIGEQVRGGDSSLVLTARHKVSGKYTVYTLEVYQAHTFRVMEEGVWVHNGCITSLVKTDKKLHKMAKETFEGNKELSKEASDLVEKFSKGNINPGIENNRISQNVFELRGAIGARVYMRKAADGTYEVLGYSKKSNQQEVINRIFKVFGK